MLESYITPADLRALVELQTEADALPKLTTHEQCAAANALRVRVNRTRLDIEARRKAAKAPFLEAGRLIDQQAALVLDPVAAMLLKLDRALTQYAQDIEHARRLAQREQEARERAAQRESEQIGLPAATVLPATNIPAPAPIKSHDVQELEVYDEPLLPDEFWIIDKVRLRQVLLDVGEVPGARMVVRRRVG